MTQPTPGNQLARLAASYEQGNLGTASLEAVNGLTEIFRVLFEHSSDAHLLFDESGIIDCNQAAIDMLNCRDRTQLLSLHPAALSPELQPDGRRSLEKSIEMDNQARTAGYHRFEWTHRKFTGEDFPVDVTLTPVTLNGKQGFLVVWHDLTDRKRMEENLRSSEARYRAVVAALAEGVIVQESDGVIQTCNDSACRILGRSASELMMSAVPNPMWHAVHEDGTEFPREEHPVTITLRTGIRCAEVFMGVRKPDEESLTWISVNTQPLYREGHALPYAVVCSFHDITERVTAEMRLRQNSGALEESNRALERSQAEAKAANEAKSGFLANMSHEIRTPMTAIVGYADLLLTRARSDRERNEYVQVIRRNANHLLELLNDILDLSKIEAGKMFANQAEFDLPELLAEVVAMVRPRAEEKGLRVILACDGPVPRMLTSDALRLRQILVNLAGNAVKFTEEGEVRLTVSSTGSMVQFDISDTGIGMNVDQVGKLFSPFMQVDESATRRFGGTGLGLAISRRLARLLGGELTVQSEFGRGSTFILQLKSGVVAATEMIDRLDGLESQPSPLMPSVAAVQITARILLAEDGRDNQRLFTTFLEDAGAEVVVAANGREAVDLAMSKKFDLILMDMQMPVLDGRSAVIELRHRGCQLPILALTAHTLAGHREKAMAAGCDGYLTKPLDRVLLIETISSHLCADSLPAAALSEEAQSPIAADAQTQLKRGYQSELANDRLLSAIIPLFVEALPQQVTDLYAHLQAANLRRLRGLAHQMKGTAGGYGFPRITEVATDLEEQIDAGAAIERVAEQVTALVELLRSVEGDDRSGEASPKR